MATSTKPPANAFVARARKVYNPIGFSKGYNFILWFIFVGALFGFSLARLEYLDFWGVFCNPNETSGNGALPGECFYYTKPGRYHIGIILHLVTIVPGALLACFQFVPIIRHKVILVHRINGYIVTLLSFIGTAAAIVIGRHAAGGGLDVQVLLGALAILFLGSLTLAIINVKRLQIEQHRAWMIRAWAYGGVVITLRIILIIGATILSSIGGYYSAQPCDKINFALGGQDATMSFYPECAAFFSGDNIHQQAVVKATLLGDNAIEAGAIFNIAFGPAGWLALVLHVFAAECYLRLTPAEHDRLRNVSYQRQLEAGMKNPGMAGLTADRLGDAPRWTPKPQVANNDSDGGNSIKELQEITTPSTQS
ncbi:hypothetical protein F5B22DRAFT_590036 [Xylaria bambusicola]|uniref:uncharacterized protein n=1 Tax=Xylaria bambusicola TaxID=326684 RepID=UPI002007ED72|nr:uncharacterized protein F5B22DRAFT_590036 [Xylaria bambusicola]KAI0525455.1 hypothetical protein F5B22DRAFT_590036 [Xylaria bambusicola]